VFSFPPVPKNFGFGSLFYKMELKQKFWQKGGYSPFWILEAKKKNPQKNLMRAINSVFWMELNMTLKILAFCIPSFQSNWYFVFCIFFGTKHPVKFAKLKCQCNIGLL